LITDVLEQSLSSPIYTERSLTSYQPTPCKIPAERKPRPHRDVSLKCRKEKHIAKGCIEMGS